MYLHKNPESVAVKIKDAVVLQRLEMHSSG